MGQQVLNLNMSYPRALADNATLEGSLKAKEDHTLPPSSFMQLECDCEAKGGPAYEMKPQRIWSWRGNLLLLSRFSHVRLCATPMDGSPPGSPAPGILQAITLEWLAISFSNAWKWKLKVKSLSCVRLLATPWTTAHQAPLSMGFSRQEYWSGVPSPSPKAYYKTIVINTM